MSSINSIGSSMSYGMAAMRRPDPQEMFKQVDSDGNGSVSQAELQALTDNISEKSGQALDAKELLSQYDQNSDSSLSQDELHGLMESIRPKHERKAMMDDQQETGSQSGGLDTTSLASYLANSGQDLVSSLISMLQQLQDASSEDDGDSSSAVTGVSGRQGPPPPPPHGQNGSVSEDQSGNSLEDSLAAVLQGADTKDLSSLIKLLQSYADGSSAGQSLNTVS